ncbi:hypothetical protein HRH25_03935 [Flavisolibacter sp. BT320]|jgi:hypothetical protein|nr:hypothetical protein [Flavisolibacter longurius]
MFTYQKFLIKDTDRFDPGYFPQLNACLQLTLEQLTTAPDGPSTDMIVSFTRHHAISSQQVKDFPQLASQISEKQFPLHVLEHLFASSRHNPTFQRDLEEYVVNCLTTGKVQHYSL